MAKEVSIKVGDKVKALSGGTWFVGTLEEIHPFLKEPYSVRLSSNQRLYGFSKIVLMEKDND